MKLKLLYLKYFVFYHLYSYFFLLIWFHVLTRLATEQCSIISQNHRETNKNTAVFNSIFFKKISLVINLLTSGLNSSTKELSKDQLYNCNQLIPFQQFDHRLTLLIDLRHSKNGLKSFLIHVFYAAILKIPCTSSHFIRDIWGFIYFKGVLHDRNFFL